jgi:hypothetical protein
MNLVFLFKAMVLVIVIFLSGAAAEGLARNFLKNEAERLKTVVPDILATILPYISLAGVLFVTAQGLIFLFESLHYEQLAREIKEASIWIVAACTASILIAARIREWLNRRAFQSSKSVTAYTTVLIVAALALGVIVVALLFGDRKTYVDFLDSMATRMSAFLAAILLLAGCPLALLGARSRVRFWLGLVWLGLTAAVCLLSIYLWNYGCIIKGDSDYEIAACSSWLVEMPDDPNLRYVRGNAYLRKKEYDAAIADFDIAERFGSREPEVYNARGVALSEKNEHEKAILSYDKAIALRSTRPQFYINRGLSQKALGHPKLAIIDFDQALKLDPTNANAFLSRGLSNILLKEYEKSTKDFSDVLRLDSKNVMALDGRRIAYTELGDQGRALADVDALYLLSPAYFRNVQKSQALAAALRSRAEQKIKRGDSPGGAADQELAKMLDVPSAARRTR